MSDTGIYRRYIWLVLSLLCCVCSSAIAATSSRGVARIEGVSSDGPSLSKYYSDSYALLIGVSDYQHSGWDRLPSVPSELASVEEMLQRQGFEVETVSNLSGRELKSKLTEFVVDKGFDKNNRLLLYFSGHGETVSLSGNRSMGYFVPADAPPYAVDKSAFVARALSMNRVMAMAKEIRSKHAMFVFDSCFSGSIFQSRGYGVSSGRSLERLLSKPVRYFITSGSADESVPSESAFARAFVDSFESGVADLNDDGYVTSTELGLHLTQNVNFSSQTPQHGKINNYRLSRGDMVFSSLSAPASSLDSAIASPEEMREDFLRRAELLYWQTLRFRPSQAAYSEYLRRFPDGEFVVLAEQALTTLAVQQAAAEVGLERWQDQPLKASVRVAIAPSKIFSSTTHWEVNWRNEADIRNELQQFMHQRLAQRGLESQLLSTKRSLGGWIRRKRSTYGIDRAHYRAQTAEDQEMMGIVVRMRDDNSAGELQFVFSSERGETISKRYYFHGEAGLKRAANAAFDQVLEPELDLVMR